MMRTLGRKDAVLWRLSSDASFLFHFLRLFDYLFTPFNSVLYATAMTWRWEYVAFCRQHQEKNGYPGNKLKADGIIGCSGSNLRESSVSPPLPFFPPLSIHSRTSLLVYCAVIALLMNGTTLPGIQCCKHPATNLSNDLTPNPRDYYVVACEFTPERYCS